MHKWFVGNSGVGRYLAAIRDWEGVFINLQVIYDLLGNFIGVTYSVGDREDRARLIANRIKHVSEDIRGGKLLEPGMPMWLTQDGFATIKVSVTFAKLGEQVRLLA